jgi:hypothetical protein
MAQGGSLPATRLPRALPASLPATGRPEPQDADLESHCRRRLPRSGGETRLKDQLGKPPSKPASSPVRSPVIPTSANGTTIRSSCSRPAERSEHCQFRGGGRGTV